jgi:sodium/potassium-transporting ATPase subunit alpha
MTLISQDAPAIAPRDPEVIEIPDSAIPQHIAFEPESRRERIQNASTSRHRSASRESISSVRSRARSVAGVPIEFRTLSFQVADSHTVEEKRYCGKVDKAEKDEDKDYFANLDFHILDGPKICQELGVDADKGLDASKAAGRLSRDRPNTFPSCRKNYFKKLFFYVFGGFCSVLWIRVIIFFIC